MLQVLDPNASHAKFPSLVPLASRFTNLIPISKLQQLDNEWRKLSFTTLPFDSEGMEPEVFWGRLGKISNGVYRNSAISYSLCIYGITVVFAPC